MERTVETSSPMALEVPLISARYARQFIRFMERKGVRRHAILGDTDISSDMLDDPDASLSMGQVRQLLGKAEWLMGNWTSRPTDYLASPCSARKTPGD